jgi:transcriptional regulator with XRE-family HTH domain
MSPDEATPPGKETAQQEGSAAPLETLGARVRELRLARGWSQQRLADETGLCKDAVTRIERGTRKPRLETLKQIAAAVGLPLTKLIDFDETAPQERASDSHAQLLQRLLDDLDPQLTEAVITFVRSLVRVIPKRRS